MWVWHKVFGSFLGPDNALAWVLSRRLPDLHAARDPVQAVHEADGLAAQDAGRPAGDEEAPGEVQGRQAAAVRRDDEAEQGGGGQPAGLLSAGADPGAGLHRAVPRAADVPAGAVGDGECELPAERLLLRLRRRGVDGQRQAARRRPAGRLHDHAGRPAGLHGRRPRGDHLVGHPADHPGRHRHPPDQPPLGRPAGAR